MVVVAPRCCFSCAVNILPNPAIWSDLPTRVVCAEWRWNSCREPIYISSSCWNQSHHQQHPDACRVRFTSPLFIFLLHHSSWFCCLLKKICRLHAATASDCVRVFTWAHRWAGFFAGASTRIGTLALAPFGSLPWKKVWTVLFRSFFFFFVFGLPFFLSSR